MTEVWGMMSLLDAVSFGNQNNFIAAYGGDYKPPAVEQIRALQV